MNSPRQGLPKRSGNALSPNTTGPAGKRRCKSPSTSSLSTLRPVPSIQEIINLPADTVYALAKSDLRNYFIALQQYTQHPYTLPVQEPNTCTPLHSAVPNILPKILTLPIEIRELIYYHLLLPPKEQPGLRGPHPRQLQTHLHLTQPFPPSILLVARQIYNEALPIFYGAPTQTVHIKIDYNVWVHKTARSSLIVSPALRSAIKHLHISIYLGSEKRNNRPDAVEKEARLTEVAKGVKKARKWLANSDIQSLIISWHEPSQTYTCEQKKGVLEGLRPLRPRKVTAGEINWGLDWNKGRKFRFPIEFLKNLERAHEDSGVDSC